VNPNVHLFNDEGTCVFISSDAHLPEYQRPRRPGCYRATFTIPGNFMSEGMFSADVAISTVDPLMVHAHERGLFFFQIMDPGEGDSMRGEFAGHIPGVIRPMLPWRTEPLPAADAPAALKAGEHG
jgi:hypothetical protein